jgi:predicted DNA-binding transcriptional regulator AlpA
MTEVKMGAPRRMLDIDAVLKFVPLTRNTIFRLEKEGQVSEEQVHHAEPSRLVRG